MWQWPIERVEKRQFADVFQSFAKFTGEHLCWGLFLIKLYAYRLEKIFKKKTLTKNFSEQVFYRTPPEAASDIPTTVQ